MLKPGMFISDRYEIVDNVGSGGMADVYKAKDQRLNRFVAIKVLKPEYSSDKSFVNKFRGEAQSAAGLSHPNIVNVYDVGDDGGLHYIVMELVEGITLKRFIERKGTLDGKESASIGIQIAQGMEAAHDNHIIHRDIKPQNIIISRDGKVKVTDFGIAKATNSNTITSNAMGSVHYLSPEQARGGYSDEKSDIYSLGVTLYEMLSGKVPFAGDNTVSVALLHIQGEAMGLRELDPNIPISVDKIVQKCMQKRPERRYHSASELIIDLKRALANPDGDFVQIPAFVASDSPTINISDDLGRIKNGSYMDNSLNDPMKHNSNIAEDDEELDSVDTKVEKVFAVGSIIAIVVLALAIIFIVLWFVLPRDNGNDPGNDPGTGVSDSPSPEPTLSPTPTEGAPVADLYKFPSVIGRTEEDAREIIKAKDLKADITTQEDFSNQYDEGYVIEQYPQADRDATEGTVVVLTISVGKEAFTIPYVYNLTEAQADRKLTDYDLIPKVEYVFSSEIEVGNVISTDPPNDSMVYAGDEVKVFISKGPEITKVPDLRGYTEADAKTLLEGIGLVLGTVDHESSEIYPEGQITFQDTTMDLEVNRGTIINVIVSTGPADTTTGGDGTGDDGNGDGVVLYYIAHVNIDINPFENGYGDGEAEITLEMEQNEAGYEVYAEQTSTTEFPLSLRFDWDVNSPASIVMYVDGEPFKLLGETEPYVWPVEFTAVEE